VKRSNSDAAQNDKQGQPAEKMSLGMGMFPVIEKLSAAGVNVNLPMYALGMAETSLKQYKDRILHNKTCPADVRASFGQSEAEALVSTWYVTSPFQCMKDPSSRKATAEAFAKFGYEEGSLVNNPMALAVECILQDTIDFLGSSWSGVNLTSMGNLHALVTYARSKALGSIQQPMLAKQDAYFPEFKALMSRYNEMVALNPEYTNQVMANMVSVFMMYGSSCFEQSDSQMRTLLYQTIEWFVNTENKYNPSKENALVGQKLLEWTESCIHFTKDGSFIADGEMLPRYLSLFTLYATRFQKWFYSILDPEVRKCKASAGDANGYSSSKLILGAFLCSTQSISMDSTGGEGWHFLKGATWLDMASAVVSCDGRVTAPVLDMS